MYLFPLYISDSSAAVTVEPTIGPPISPGHNCATHIQHRPHRHNHHPSHLPTSPIPGPSCTPEQGVYSCYHNKKWIERLASLCHRKRGACLPSRHAKGLVVVTGKMAAASDDCSDSAYICQANDSFLSLSVTFWGAEVPSSDCSAQRVPQNDLLFNFWKAGWLCSRDRLSFFSLSLCN